jgi:dolichol-phosphate mannosyltransferase
MISTEYPSQFQKITPKDCLVALFTYNNGSDLETTLQRFGPNYPYPVVVHVDGSMDGSDVCLKNYTYPVLRNHQNRGIGRSIKNVIEYARSNSYQVIVLIAGNNKNDPWEISRLVEPILNGKADYVQGSRFLTGGQFDHTPILRLIMVKLYSSFFSLVTKHKCTDALEGFRAYKLSILDDPRINIWQDWLDTYEYETYVHYKVMIESYKVTEVPVSKIYPHDKKNLLNPKGKKYSFIRPFRDWWLIMRPLFYLILGLKQ